MIVEVPHYHVESIQGGYSKIISRAKFHIKEADAAIHVLDVNGDISCFLVDGHYYTCSKNINESSLFSQVVDILKSRGCIPSGAVLSEDFSPLTSFSKKVPDFHDVGFSYLQDSMSKIVLYEGKILNMVGTPHWNIHNFHRHLSFSDINVYKCDAFSFLTDDVRKIFSLTDPENIYKDEGFLAYGSSDTVEIFSSDSIVPLDQSYIIYQFSREMLCVFASHVSNLNYQSIVNFCDLRDILQNFQPGGLIDYGVCLPLIHDVLSNHFTDSGQFRSLLLRFSEFIRINEARNDFYGNNSIADLSI